MGKKARAKHKREAREASLEGATLVKAAHPVVDEVAPSTVEAPKIHATPETLRTAVTPEPVEAVDTSQLATRLNSAAIHLLRRLHREDANLGLSAARLSALSVLVFGGPRTLGQLARAEGVTPPSMTRLVTAMESEGLVERSPSPSDGRSIIIRASVIGEEILVRGREQRVVALAGWLSALSSADLAILGDAAGLLEEVLRERRSGA